jgi:hypothetical protein
MMSRGEMLAKLAISQMNDRSKEASEGESKPNLNLS